MPPRCKLHLTTNEWQHKTLDNALQEKTKTKETISVFVIQTRLNVFSLSLSPELEVVYWINILQ